MAQAIEAETAIHAPIDQVWRALTDWDNAHRWMSGIDSMSADGETAVGTMLTFQARGKDRPSEIVAVDPGRSVTLRSVQGGVSADYVYALMAVTEDTTRATLNASCETDGLLWTAAGPLLRLVIRRTDGNQLELLKAYVEDA